MNPFLFLLAMLAGFAISWFLVVKTARRGGTAARSMGRRPAQAVGGASAYPAATPAAGAALGGASRAAVGAATASGAGAADATAATAAAATGEVDLDEGEPTVATDVAALAALDDDPALPPSVESPADGSAPAGYHVKGDRKARLYLLADDADFARARPDIWFLSEDAARDAGFSHYVR